MSVSGFSGRAGGILAGVVGLSLMGGMVLSVFADRFEKPSVEADTTSRSAIGHLLFRNFLEARGWEVEVSRARTAERVTPDHVLVIAEPRIEADDDERLGRLADAITYSGAVLLVLPKRRGWTDDEDSGHIIGEGPRPVQFAETAFDLIEVDGEVTRSGTKSEELTWIDNDIGLDPRIDDVQLIRSSTLDPVVEAREGILLGFLQEFDGPPIFVLSDPDVIANHGLSSIENARFLDALLDALVDGEMPVVIDETAHEIAAPESIWAELLTLPLVLVTLTAVLLAGLLVWAACGRWGTLRRVAFGRRRGKHELIDNTAELLELGRHAGHSLGRLLRHAHQDVARALHAPAELDRDARRDWIEGAARSRGLHEELIDVEREISEIRARRNASNKGSVAVARRLYSWKEKMIHGSRADSRHG